MKKWLASLSLFVSAWLLLGFAPVSASVGPVVKAGETVYLDGQIDGDALLFGGEVVVNATISGDLIVIAGQADIRGQVGSDLRVIAGQLNLDAKVVDDVSLAAGQIEVSPRTRLEQSLLVAAAKIRFNGQAAGPATILASAIDIFSQAEFSDNLTLVYGQTPRINSQATISGELTQTYAARLNPHRQAKKLAPKTFPSLTTLTGFFVLEQLAALTVEILIGWLLILLLPQAINRLIKLSSTHGSASIGWGFLFFSLTPFLILLLLLTLIGIPLGVVVLLIYVIALCSAKLLAALIVGSRLLPRAGSKKPYLSFSLGAIILAVLQLIPVLGWLTVFILILYGLGLLVLTARASLLRFKQR